mmetsp:Transcript_62941/g.147721  ORF Transcript_62941/g.147721 Transcript_62941/m.147721 type:complete len:498 (+) Transcript_62941:83-1576(+)
MAEQRAADDLYRKTLRFLVSVAAELTYPECQLRGGHTLGDGFLYELEGGKNSDQEVEAIQKTLTDLVESGDAIESISKPWSEAVSYFQKKQLSAALDLLKTRSTAEVACYQCRGVLRLNLFPLHDRAASLKAGSYALVRCKETSGFVAAYTKETLYKPQPALLQSHTDHKSFCKGYQVRSVGGLNGLQQVGRGRKDFVLACEFRQETKLAEIVAQVKVRMAEGKQVKVICIAGPTSSGKTTFATKLCMYLQNYGFVAKSLTVDHYYLPLDRQPKYQARKQRSDVDYDHIESMDVELICEHLNALVAGKSVMTPVYNMKTGYRDGDGHHFDALPSNGILVIEGIHALNPLYTQAVSNDKLFKIFISPLTSLQLDDHNCVKTTNHRLLRRMSRDYLFRGNSAARTLSMWDNVRKGEGVWIFPHQNNADFVMNSAAEYEIPVLKTFIEPLLRAVTPEDETFPKAQEMLKLLDLFATWPPELTPPLALLREFIGDGAFDCH